MFEPTPRFDKDYDLPLQTSLEQAPYDALAQIKADLET
jgi:hypothetical protein